MTDSTVDQTVISASSIEIDRAELDESIKTFAGENGDYYAKAFHSIHAATNIIPKTFNVAAAALGPFWAASRAIWGMFWTFLILEIIAWVQIGRGLWGDPGAELRERAEGQLARSEELMQRARDATEASDVDRFTRLAENIGRAAETTLERAAAAQAEATGILLWGLALLVFFKLIQGLYGNNIYERQYSRWRIDPEGTESGVRKFNIGLGAALGIAIAPLVIYKFTVDGSIAVLDEFPEDATSAMFLGQGGGTLFATIAQWMEGHIDAAAAAGGDVFDGIVLGVRSVLDALTVALIGTPWPVVMLVIVVTAWRSAGA
ncbi:MAG: proline/glycine betaine ABC transporter permease, partial [Pseudomonadota bacterium]